MLIAKAVHISRLRRQVIQRHYCGLGCFNKSTAAATRISEIVYISQEER
jgi:hypothetical protein